MTENNKCLVCTSPHRAWIENEYNEGRSARDLSKALKDMHNVDISHSSISNHLSKHMGSNGDRMAVLEQRLRNLEVWMDSALGLETFLTWIPKLPGTSGQQTVSYRNTYMQTIPDPEKIEAESIAILSTISARMDEEEAERDRQQKEVWAREKKERDRLTKIAYDEQEAAQKKIAEEAKRVEIEKMRKSVEEYDRKSK